MTIKDYVNNVTVTVHEEITNVRVENQEVIVKQYDTIVINNIGGGGGQDPEPPYVTSFVNTTAVTVLALTHGIDVVRDVTVFNESGQKILCDVSVNQTNQNVTIEFVQASSGTIIIF